MLIPLYRSNITTPVYVNMTHVCPKRLAMHDVNAFTFYRELS